MHASDTCQFDGIISRAWPPTMFNRVKAFGGKSYTVGFNFSVSRGFNFLIIVQSFLSRTYETSD